MLIIILLTYISLGIVLTTPLRSEQRVLFPTLSSLLCKSTQCRSSFVTAIAPLTWRRFWINAVVWVAIPISCGSGRVVSLYVLLGLKLWFARGDKSCLFNARTACQSTPGERVKLLAMVTLYSFVWDVLRGAPSALRSIESLTCSTLWPQRRHIVAHG